MRKQGVSSGAKRKRQPDQVHDHILAERKRRELLSQLFISLSALVPGLKKMDKTSILGEAVKYMKQLKENVKTLEEVVAKRTVQSMVVMNKSQLIIDNCGVDNDSSSTIDDNCASGTSGSGNNGGDGGGHDVDNLINGSLPEIEVKILGNTLLLRLKCKNKKGIMNMLFAELDNYNCTVTNFSAMKFETLALDVTVVAQIEGDFNKKLKQFMRTLRSALQ
ncbi:transcription factor bHLH25-like [Amaranthus tricolor]|uniref:transcription factor bHLH25-like n=1 Tax=Amaranthus tricolor TaxID=29722 RepID=UPI00258FD015|nr:transcription factor bHLH25-like [Amaranthus tricolor]